MFKYISVKFPASDEHPNVVYSANIHQDRFKHEMAHLVFKDWNVKYDNVTSNSPVLITFRGTHVAREFYGYVETVKPVLTAGKNFTEVSVIGASSLMRQQEQTVYKNITADQVAKKIAAKYGFVCYAVPHPRVYEQIAQAGRSDWELLKKLAKQCGYSLRAQNTELYFQPMLEDYTKYRSEARVFTLRPPEDITGTTIYSFTPTVGESLQYDEDMKAAVAVSGSEPVSKGSIRKTADRNKKTRLKQKPEVFDRFATTVVADTPEIAQYEAEAAENRNSFPYRAYVEVLGEADLRPDFPVYLSGVGNAYSGYWTILGTEHKIIETELNRFTYTTVLHVGTDSLGKAGVWKDNAYIPRPEETPYRTIIPNVKQTKVVPKTNLNYNDIYKTPSSIKDIGLATNRPTIEGYVVSAPLWTSGTASLNEISTEVRKPAYVIDRLRRIASK